MRHAWRWCLRLVLGLGALVAVAGGQEEWYNHPELEWRTFETEHFLIHFHQGTERSAREAASVAEKIYGPVTRIYNYRPSTKTHLIIKDVDDVSNGITYFFENKIEIWARPLDFDLRGSHRWMQGVITHEFVHIVQLAAAMKFTSRVPGFYFQALGYEEEKREDVLYGYPNVLISYPYPGVNIPPWFAEGVAQFMYPGANYDYWDTHRDMILRDRVLNGDLLSFAAMNSFGKRGIGNESVYTQGFAFVRYLADRFDVVVLEDISRIMAMPLAISISRAMERVTGTPGHQLYREWQAELENHYSRAVVNVREHQIRGDILVDEGSTNLHPVWHPSERKFAFLSNQRSDFFGQTDLYVYDFASGKAKHIAAMAESAPCWSNDGRKLYYAGRSKPGKTGARWLDLFVYDLESRKKERLTHGERVTSPVLVEEGRAIAYLTVRDGTSNIRVIDPATRKITTLSAFEGGEYIHSLTYDPQDSLLIFDATLNHGRQLMQLRLVNGEIALHLPNRPNFPIPADTRDPVVTQDNLIFATDASGVFNLYLSGKDGEHGYVTNVTGGAFMPSVNSQGEVLYSIYQNGGYKVAYLANPALLEAGLVGMPADLLGSRASTSPREGPDMALAPQPYEETMSPLFIMPRLTVDYGTLKPGLYFYANEVLDHLLLFGGTSINVLKDTDFFLLFEFRKFRPTLYAQIYALQRHISKDTKFYDIDVSNDLRFNLLEGVIGGRMALGRHRLWLEGTLSQYREHIDEEAEGRRGSISFPYYRGATVTARWQLSSRRPEYGGNMFPTKGYEVEMELRGEKNDLVGGFRISEDYSTLVPDFVDNNTLRLNINFKQHITLHRRSRITAAYESTLGWLSNTEIDTFFYFFGGGLPGLKGYTYYDSTVQGTNLMVHTVTLRIPVILQQHIPLWQLILQNASVGFVVQYGDGFQGSWLKHRYKTSVGLEVRLSGHNFYVFPFALAYEVHRPLGSDFKAYRHYFSLLFDF